jgi:hypothetical protein
MHRPLIAAAALFAIAGCGEEKKEPRTADEVIAEAGKLDAPRPGQYETSVEMIDFSIPGIPAQQAEQMKSMMGGMGGKASAYCLTPAEAEKGFEESVRKMTEGTGGMECEFGRFAVDGGKLDAALTCKGPQGMNADIALAGTAAAETSSMRMKMVQKAAMIPGGEVRMEMRMDSKRIGDCPAAGA